MKRYFINTPVELQSEAELDYHLKGISTTKSGFIDDKLSSLKEKLLNDTVNYDRHCIAVIYVIEKYESKIYLKNIQAKIIS